LEAPFFFLRLGVLERREADLLLVRRAERDLDLFFFDDFFEDFFDDIVVFVRLELRFFEVERRDADLEELALDFDRRLGLFGVRARLAFLRRDLRSDLDFFDDFGVRERRLEDLRAVDALELLEDRRDFDLLGDFGVCARRALFLFEDFFDDFFEDLGVRDRRLRFEAERRDADLEELRRVDTLDLERRLGLFGVRARLALLRRDLRLDLDFFDDFGVRERRDDLRVDALDPLDPLEDRVRRDLDLLGDLGVRARLALFFFDDFFDVFFEDLGVRERRLRFEAERRDADLEELRRVDALDLDFELRLGLLGARARRAARRAVRRATFRREVRFLLIELLLGFLGVFALRTEEDLLAFLLFFSALPSLWERFLLALIPISLLRLPTISAL